MPDVDAEPEHEDRTPGIRKRVLSGLKWTVGVRVTSQILSWLATLFVIRLLQPEDFGLQAMVMVFMSLVLLLSTAGAEQAIIQAKTLDSDQIQKLFGVLVLLNVGLGGLQIAGAPLIAAYYQDPRVVPLMIALSAGLLTVPFVCIPAGLLAREMNFKHYSLADMSKAITSSIATLTLAWRGYGVWSLVLGQLAGMLMHAVFLNVVKSWRRIPKFSLRGVEGLVQFGGTVLGAYLVWTCCWGADAFLGGRFLGAEVLGIYAVAAELSLLPMRKVMPLLHQVAFPAYSQLQDKPEEMSWYFVKALRLVSLLMVPLAFGFAAVAQWAVPLFLTDRWEVIVTPIMLLSLTIPLRAIVTMNGPLLNALGLARVNLTNAVIALAILVPGLVIGMQWGLLGLCVAWAAAFPIVFVVLSLRTVRILGMPPTDFIVAVLPAIASGVAMLVVLWLAGSLPLIGSNDIVALLVLVPAGALVYFGIVKLFFPERLTEAFELMRSRK